MRASWYLALRRFVPALLLVIAPCSVSADDAIQDRVVVARSTGGAILIWDATIDIRVIVREKLSDQAANDRLERDGLKALASELDSLDKSNAPITERIVYSKLGEFNPVYKAATLTGIERYATIVMSGKDAFGKRDKWNTLRPGAKVPAWVHYKVIGLLPPR